MGYPALVDEGETVGVRVFATPPEAAASHERGTARLIQLAMAREIKSLRRDLAVNVQGEMVYRALDRAPAAAQGAGGRTAICATTCSTAP